MLATRRTKFELHWGARPYRTPTKFLGLKTRYIEVSHTYEIVRFSEGLGDYLLFKGGVRIAVKKSLSGAKRAAEKDARASRVLLV